MGTNATRRKLDGLQVLRALAASAVVFEHVAFHARLGRMPVECPRWFELGHLGVDLFFVLSGFIIVHVHGDDIGRPGRAGDYAWRRFARVWPLLAILTTFKLLAGLAMPGLVPEDRYRLGVVATSYLCLPHPDWPVLSVAWTLRHEALFYACFALLVVGGRRVASALILMWIAGALVAVAWRDGPLLLEFVGNPLNAHFLFGCAVAAWIRRAPVAATTRAPSAWWLAPITANLVAALVVYGRHMDSGLPALALRLWFGLGCAALVAWFVRRELASPLRAPRWLVALGDASYSLYLWHGFVVALLLSRWTRLPEWLQDWPVAWIAATTALAFASSWWLHILVERPTGKLLDAWWRGRR